MNDPDHVHTQLRKIFPECGVHMLDFGDPQQWQQATVFADDGEGVLFRFEHMPKIAEAFGTERLDFCAIEGASIIDSVTYDGSCLIIQAKAIR